MYYNHRKYKLKKRLIQIIIVFLFMLIGFIIFDKRLKDVVVSVYSSYTKKVAADAVVSAVNEQLGKEDELYNDILKITTDEKGNITSIQTDVKKLNKISAGLSERIISKLENEGKFYIYIPFGSIFNNYLLGGKGPKIKLKGIFPPGYIDSDVKSSFTSAGINQTKHTLYLEFKANANIILATENVNMDFTTKVSIGETIIVGEVPESYTNVDGDDSSTLEKINNYVD